MARKEVDEIVTAHAAGVRALMDAGDLELALALARARVLGIRYGPRRGIILEADEPDYDVLNSATDPVVDDTGEVVDIAPLWAAFEDAIPYADGVADNQFPEVTIRKAQQQPPERLQGSLYPGPGPIEHRGMKFRSKTEVRVARALDDANVLYFPLPIAVRHLTSLEPDFVVIHLGRVGVLEIDGPHHTALTRAREDARAAFFQQSGIRLVRHYAVSAVDADPAAVVKDFLQLLRGPTL